MTIRITLEVETVAEAVAALTKLGADAPAAVVAEAAKPSKGSKGKKTEPAEPSTVVGGAAPAAAMPSVTDISTSALNQPAPAVVQTPVTAAPAAAVTPAAEPQLADVIGVLTLVGQKKSLGREALVAFMKTYSTNGGVTGIPKEKWALCIADAQKQLAAAP